MGDTTTTTSATEVRTVPRTQVRSEQGMVSASVSASASATAAGVGAGAGGRATPSSTDATMSNADYIAAVKVAAVKPRPAPRPPLPEPSNKNLSYDVDKITPGALRRVCGGFKPAAGVHPLIILEVENEGLFVLKADADVENEFYTSELFRTGLGERMVPKMKLLRKAEYAAAMRELGQKFDLPIAREFSHDTPSTFLVMQYLAGAKTLKDADFNRAIFSGGIGRVRLFTLGMIAAYDLVILNNDRFPGVITRGFNKGNMMFRTQEEDFGANGRVTVTRPMPIDNNVAQLTPDQIREKAATGSTNRMVQLSSFLDDLVADSGKVITLAGEMVTRLRENTFIENPMEAKFAIADGIREGLMNLSSGNVTAVTQLVAQMRDVDAVRANLVEQSLATLKAKKEYFVGLSFHGSRR